MTFFWSFFLRVFCMPEHVQSPDMTVVVSVMSWRSSDVMEGNWTPNLWQQLEGRTLCGPADCRNGHKGDHGKWAPKLSKTQLTNPDVGVGRGNSSLHVQELPLFLLGLLSCRALLTAHMKNGEFLFPVSRTCESLTVSQHGYFFPKSYISPFRAGATPEDCNAGIPLFALFRIKARVLGDLQQSHWLESCSSRLHPWQMQQQHGVFTIHEGFPYVHCAVGCNRNCTTDCTINSHTPYQGLMPCNVMSV